MFIKKSKKIIYIYCEGISEKNYFEALKGNKVISKFYVLKPNSKENDLKNAIKKSERLEGLKNSIVVIYVYDSDNFKKKKNTITNKIISKTLLIYFNEEIFEDFLICHKVRPVCKKGKKLVLSRQLIQEIRSLDDCEILKKFIKTPRKFKKFKSIYNLLIELFEQKLQTIKLYSNLSCCFFVLVAFKAYFFNSLCVL